MKNLAFVCFSMLVFFSCQDGNKKTPETSDVATDSVAIAGVIHGFYQWYDKSIQTGTEVVNFTKTVNNHYALDLPLLEKYLANIKSSGFISAEFLDNERAFYKSCEKIWQKEEADGPPAGMDADKYEFCHTDWQRLR